jgi:serine/threonine-protein kinase RsbW
VSQHAHPTLGLDTGETGKTRGERVDEGERVSGPDDVLDDEPNSAGAYTRVSQTYPAVPQSVAVVRSVVGGSAAQGGATAETIDAVRIAVSEAATNVIVHAYPEAAEDGLISVELTLAGDELRVSVADTGRGLRAHEEGPRPGLGLGLAIISQLADHVELLQGDHGGLHVLMRFSLSASTHS